MDKKTFDIKKFKEKAQNEEYETPAELLEDVYKMFHTDTQNISDGYHTFDELYKHRYALFAVLCNQLYLPENCYKCRKHADGTMYEGWFIVVVNLPTVGQISYHIPEKYWDKFNVREKEKSNDFDGHTSEDVIKRLWDYAII